VEWRYQTRQGDTWDVLAFDIYGSEMLAHVIQQANPELLGYIFFPSGLTLRIPETPPLATNQPLPPWER